MQTFLGWGKVMHLATMRRAGTAPPQKVRETRGRQQAGSQGLDKEARSMSPKGWASFQTRRVDMENVWEVALR